jgi:lipid II:glycine glycyltransferase (peptidoglycan interpeptide bridge formation enzyme)
MFTWKTFTDQEDAAAWDQALTRFDQFSPFQSYAWGEQRRALGWKPYRWMARNDANEIVAMMQGYVRRYPCGIGLVWSEGGPAGDLSLFDHSFTEAVKEATGLRLIYYRFRCDRPRNIEDALRLTALGWSMPWSPLTPNYTMTIDVSRTPEQLLASCERNWRRNLKRSTECNLSIKEWFDASAEEVVDMYRSMETVKGLEEQHSLAEVEQLLNHLRDKIILFRCDDEDGRLVSVMGCLVTGERACLVLSATGQRGREVHASYAIFWHLIQRCHQTGIREFDFAGIDPIRNPGVYRFKRAAGGVPVELLGEWDWATRPWLRWVGNWAIAKRSRIREAEDKLNRSKKTSPNYLPENRAAASAELLAEAQ